LRTSDFAEVGHYALYNNGALIYETDFVDSTGTGTDTFDVSGHGPFDQIVFSALIQTDLSDGSDYGISDLTFTPSTPNGQQSDDSIRGGDGADLIYGNAGDDTIDGGTGNDTLFGENGSDTFILNDGYGSDQITGGDEGGDTDVIDASGVTATGGVNVQLTGDEAGTIASTEGTTSFSEIESFALTDQDDIFNGTSSTSDLTVDGGAGDDSLSGGSGSDTLLGGTGADTIDGGAGADSLTGGSGADVFIADGTADTISDFDTTTGIGNATTTDNDFVDLTNYYNRANLDAWNAANPGQTYASPLGWLKADQADGTLNQAGGLQIREGGSAVAPSALTTENTGVVCFARGTRIRVPGGEVPIEMLRSGDLVQTRDNGVKPIRWIGNRSLGKSELEAVPKLLPIVLQAGHFGLERDLIVSPQHGVLLRDPKFGGSDILYRARHLAEMQGGGARIMRGRQQVTYFHILFDQHEVVFSNGIPSESLYPGLMALKSLSAPAQAEIGELFPDLPRCNVRSAFGVPTTAYSRRKHLPDHLNEIRTSC